MGQESYDILKEAWDDFTYYVNEIEVDDQATDLSRKHKQLDELHQQAERAVKMGDLKTAEHYRARSKSLSELINKINTPNPPKVVESVEKGIELSKKAKGADDAMRRLNERANLGQMNRMHQAVKSGAGKIVEVGGDLMKTAGTAAAETTITGVVKIASAAGMVSITTIIADAAQQRNQPKPDILMNQYYNYLANWVTYAIKELLHNGGNIKAIRRVKLFKEWLKSPSL
jgi:hypothetical protein